jgi:glycosyltransferase involved in cell wall biosynthesis
MGLHLVLEALGIKHSGGATVLQEVLAAAIADERISQVSLFCSPRNTRKFDLPDSLKLRVYECPLLERNRLLRLYWFLCRSSSEAQRLNGDVLLCLGGIGSAKPGIRQVVLVQQSLMFVAEALSMCRLPERVRLRMQRAAVKWSCSVSQQVVVQTPTMQRLASKHFGIPMERIRVIVPDARNIRDIYEQSSASAQMRVVQPDRRLLYVGSQAVYKNLPFAISVIRELRHATPDLTLFATWPSDHPACQVDGVVGLGYLQGAALREAYELATALIMPSLAETVGLPMLEAMNAGTPVLAADRPYAHDVFQEAALFFDPHDSDDLKAKVMNLISSPALRDDLRTKGRILIEQRKSDEPYRRLMDIVVGVASPDPQPPASL